MGRIGMGELLVIFGIALLIFGPSKLPALAKSLGTAVKEFRKGQNDLTKNIEKLAEEPVVEPVNAAVKQEATPAVAVGEAAK